MEGPSVNKVSIESIVSAGLVFGGTLAWADVIKTGTNYIFPSDKMAMFEAKLIYAIVITLIIILIIYLLSKAQDVTNIVVEKVSVQTKNKNPGSSAFMRAQAYS